MKRLACLLALLTTVAAHASVSVVDDAGRAVTLAAPAQRIVSLAPSLTDTLFAAGAGTHVVGTTRYSDHPEAAKAIPTIGDAMTFDLERIVALKPDVVMAWKSGTPAARVEKLAALHIPVFYMETTRLADVPGAIRRLGRLAGTEGEAERQAVAFGQRVDALRRAHQGQPTVSVFFQVWNRPLMTVGGQQMISDAIALCGGRNVFADLAQAAPTVTREAVLARNPDVITGGGDGGALADWLPLTSLKAVQHRNVFAVEAPTLALPSPSVIDGVEALCRALDGARSRIAAGHTAG